MKQKYTKKSIRNNGVPVIAIGYCEVQTLFPSADAYGYSSGSYGWDCDYHMVYGDNLAIISTGYRPIGTTADNEIVKMYEANAKMLRRDFPYDEFVVRLKELQKGFVSAIIQTLTPVPKEITELSDEELLDQLKS